MRGRRIYVASSWRNTYQPGVVAALREAGHEVYDSIDEPIHTFMFTCYEVKVDLEVDPATGEAEIVAVDGRALAPRSP